MPRLKVFGDFERGDQPIERRPAFVGLDRAAKGVLHPFRVGRRVARLHFGEAAERFAPRDDGVGVEQFLRHIVAIDRRQRDAGTVRDLAHVDLAVIPR